MTVSIEPSSRDLIENYLSLTRPELSPKKRNTLCNKLFANNQNISDIIQNQNLNQHLYETPKQKRLWNTIVDLHYLANQQSLSTLATLSDSNTINKTILTYFHNLDYEKVVVIGIDGDSHVIDSLETNTGDRSEVIIDIPRITRWALNANLTGVLIAHNHPTTDVRPSADDLQEIQKLSEALNLFNISLVGSAIVNNEHVSWNKK